MKSRISRGIMTEKQMACTGVCPGAMSRCGMCFCMKNRRCGMR